MGRDFADRIFDGLEDDVISMSLLENNAIYLRVTLSFSPNATTNFETTNLKFYKLYDQLEQ